MQTEDLHIAEIVAQLITWLDRTRDCRLGILFNVELQSYDEAYFESLSKSAEEPENTGGLDRINFRGNEGLDHLSLGWR